METILLSFGANMERRRETIRAAIGLLEESGVHIIKMSSFYLTAPVGVEDQNDFINAAAMAETSLEPLPLLNTIKDIERRLGRDMNGPRWGPRSVDIDIIFFGQRKVNEDDLIIPHPLFAERLFVLAPLLEIAPDFTMPDGTTLKRFSSERKKVLDYSLQQVEKLS